MTKPTTVRLVVVHASSDEEFFCDFRDYVAATHWRSLVRFWHKGLIEVGKVRHDEMTTAIREAQVLVVLLSAALLATDEWPRGEVLAALRRRQVRYQVRPVLLRWIPDVEQFAGHLLLPSNGTPVQQWPAPDKAWLDVVRGVEQAVTEVAGALGCGMPRLFDLILGSWILEIRAAQHTLATAHLHFTAAGFSGVASNGPGAATNMTGVWSILDDHSVVLQQVSAEAVGGSAYATTVRFSLLRPDLMKSQSTSGEEVIWRRPELTTR